MVRRSDPIRVLVVDDREEFLDAACSWLASYPGMQVAGTARDGREAIAETERHHPELVLMDVFMPGLDGFEATRRIKMRKGAPWVVLISLDESSAVEQEAWIVGADAFVPKAQLSTRLPAILRALEGDEEGPGSGGARATDSRRKRPGVPGLRPPRNDAERTIAEHGIIRLFLRRIAGALRNFRDRFSIGKGAGLEPAFAHPSNLDRAPFQRLAGGSGGRRSVETSLSGRKGMFRNRYLLIIGLVALLAAVPASARVDFTPIEGGEFVIPIDMTADASTIVAQGSFGAPYYIYTEADGLVNIGGGGSGGQISISDDGSVIVANGKDEDGKYEAAKWLGGTDWLLMGSEPGALPCGSSLSSAYDTNNDTAVGLFWRAQLCKAIGGTWDVVVGVAGPPLESTVPNRPTRGNAITDDGTIVGGWQDAESGERNGVLWVNGVQQYLEDTDGTRMGEVLGLNNDATVIWGANYRYNGEGRGWLYRDGQFLPMGVGGIGRNIQSPVFDATDDGSTAIGITRDFDQFIQYGWIWTEKHGWSKFDDFLKGNTAAGWRDMIPTMISPDGRIIAGYGINPQGVSQAWILDRKAKGHP